MDIRRRWSDGLSPRQFLWGSFAIFVAVGLCWDVSTPVFNAPDEPHHVIRAATVVRGELLEPQARMQPNGWTSVRAPESYTHSGISIRCYAFQRERPANCANFVDSSRLVDFAARFGRYPPAYYAVVGLPTLFITSPSSVYLLRAVTVLLVAALLALGVTSIARLTDRRVAAMGFAFAVTPMVFFLGSVVNPSGVEIAAAISIWASGAVLVSELEAGVDPVVVRRVGIAAGALALTRQLGPLWLAIAAVALAALAGRAGLRKLVASRAARGWAVVVAAALMLQFVWIAVSGTLNVTDPSFASHDPTNIVLRQSFGLSYAFFVQMIGVFGWLDTPVPNGVVVIWAVVLGVLVVLAAAWSLRRHAAVLGGVLLLAYAVPIALEAYSAPKAGYLWQGRYGMPLAVGVPILAGVLLARSPAVATIGRRLVTIVAVAFFVGQFFAYAQSFRRNTVGYDGPIAFFVHPHWHPAIPAALLSIGYVAVLAVLTAWLFWMAPVRVRSAPDAVATGAGDESVGPSGSPA
jgi:Predicted membrane protein (DUF2142)